MRQLPSSRCSDVSTSTPPAFFIVGCQRSGSNWLRTMLGEREDLFAPHPPHIMRDFFPILSKFGNLDRDPNNLKMLVDHVCTFVENNQVQWQDKHGRALKFERKAIFEGAMISVRCLRSVKMLESDAMTPEEKGFDAGDLSLSSKINAIIDQKYYLLAIFDEIMQAGAKANGKSIWVCKSMGMSKFHKMLLTFYGEERLRYIYLVRDPRDVCMSFMKTPVGDCHPFAISKKWAHLQRNAANIMTQVPQLIHRVSYEDILHDQQEEMNKIDKFMGSRALCKTMRRGSVAQLKEVSQLCADAKEGNESTKASKLSVQFKNLTRGDSFKKEQFQKWASGAMSDNDILIVESCCLEEMTLLGYDTHIVGKSKERMNFSDELVSEYTKENESLVHRMMQDLSKNNPEDFERRNVQSSVMESPRNFFSASFAKLDIDPYATTDDDKSETCFDHNENNCDEEKVLLKWPIGASEVGFLSDEEIRERFDIQETKTSRLGKNKGATTLTYAAATQRGYYPSDRKKTENQDAFFAGPCFPTTVDTGDHKDKIAQRALFAVFDGHGAFGDGCAKLTRDVVKREMMSCCTILKKSNKKDIVPEHSARTFVTADTFPSSDSSIHGRHVRNQSIPQALERAYSTANDILGGRLDEGDIDASESGTTAVSLVIGDDGLLHIANTGDSRCLIVSNRNGCNHVSISTSEHSLDNIEEVARVEENGGLVMTSEQYDVMDAGLASFEPARVWSKEGKFPGCSFSRSIGDIKAKKLGVIADPEMIEHQVCRDDCLFILGSDGIFDFISNEEAVNIATKYDNPSDACRTLVGLAYKRWIEEEERADDITVIVGRIVHEPRLFGLRLPRWRCTA